MNTTVITKTSEGEGDMNVGDRVYMWDDLEKESPGNIVQFGKGIRPAPDTGMALVRWRDGLDRWEYVEDLRLEPAQCSWGVGGDIVNGCDEPAWKEDLCEKHIQIYAELIERQGEGE